MRNGSAASISSRDAVSSSSRAMAIFSIEERSPGPVDIFDRMAPEQLCYARIHNLRTRLCGYVFVFDSNNLVCLWAFTALDDVELDLVPLFQALIAVDLNGAVVDENVRSVFAPEKPVPLRIVEPFDRAPILRQCRSPRFLARRHIRAGMSSLTQILDGTFA